jgi:hypothetical protein
MKIAMAMLCGAVTSAAWIAPAPLYYGLAFVSLVLFIVTRGMP